MRYICLESNEHGYEQREKRILWEFSDPSVFAGCSFSGELERADGSKVEIGCEWRGERVLLTFPALEAGRYEFDVMASGEDGEQERVAHGWYGVEKVITEQEGNGGEWVTQKILIPGELGKQLRYRWMQTYRAEEAAQRSVEALEKAEEASERLDETQGVVDALKGEVADALSISADGTLVIGDRDTGFRLKGDRGMNADEVQYHLISDASELPTDAEHCNPNHRYLVQGRAAVAATGWVDFVMSLAGAGDGLWLYINGSPVIVEESGAPVQVWADVINNNLGTFGVVATADGNYLRLTAARPGAAGNLITLVSRDSVGQPYMPTSGDTLSGGEDAELTEQYIWVDGAWVVFPLNAPQRATTQNDGLVRVGTDEEVLGGLPVGFNADGQLEAKADAAIVPDATTAVKGKVLLAGAVTGSDTGAATGKQVHDYVNDQVGGMRQDIISEVEAHFSATLDEKVEAAVSAVIGNLLPIGSIIALPYDIDGNGTAPDGWMFCHGQAISRTEYSRLFEAIGTTWGYGNGTTTFNLPDCRNRVHRGCSSSRNIGTYEQDGLPNIKGAVYGFTATSAGGAFQKSSTKKAGAYGVYQGETLAMDASKYNSIYGAASEVRPKAFVAHYIIKVR